MRRWFLLSSYHWLALFLALSVSAVLLAWVSFGLINLAMANFDFLRRHGLMAIAEGGLLQSLVIGAKGLLALICYIVFKSVETELVYRWRAKDNVQ